MLNNINKVRRIAKAQFGLSVPSGNPYMTTNGLAIPGNSNTQYNLLGTDYATEFNNRAEQIMAPTNNLIDFNAKMGDLFSLKLQNDRNTPRAQMNTNGVTTPISTSSSSKQLFQKLGGWNTAEHVTDFANSLLFGGQREYDSPVANGLSQTYDFISNNAPPQLGLVMKGAKFVGNGLSALGLKSDNNMFNGVPIVENMTSIGAKKSHNLAINKDAIEKGGGSYTGTITNANKIQSKAGKSFSVFNSGSRRHTNRTVDALNGQFVDMGHIMDKATDMASIATNMSDLNHLQYSFNQNGGYDQRYMRAAKFGTKIQRIKKLNLQTYKTGGQINGSVNLETQEIEWQPTIIEEVEQFEEGGTIWSPVILESGGKTKEKPKVDEPEVEETTQKNIIPEGALHAHKHHMENSEGLTQKGIPVVDEDGEQQAEIEKNEIIFTLEVTKKLEELYSKYTELPQKEKDEAAIEAGKLLVEQVLFNTEDRTGLISTLEKGGVIDGPK